MSDGDSEEDRARSSSRVSAARHGCACSGVLRVDGHAGRVALRDLLDEGVSFREVMALAAKQESDAREYLVNAMMARAVKQYSRVGEVVFLREIELDKEESALQEIDLVREKASYRREFDVFLKNWGEQ
ncbi:MAG: hypothetical protein Q7S47_00810 [bacterium]|nr:hypothetical protein [bacterium]